MGKTREKTARVKPPKGTAKKLLRTVFGCCPLSAPLFIAYSLAAVGASFLQLYLLERLVDGVAGLAAGGAAEGLAWTAAGFALCLTVRQTWVVNQLFHNRLCYRLNVKFAPRIMEKYARLEYRCYEDRELKDVMHLSTDNPIVPPVNSFLNAVSAVTAVLSAFSVVFYLLTVSAWLALAYGLLIAVVSTLDVLASRELIKVRWEQSPDNRRMEDVSAVIRSKHSLFELKLFGGAPYLLDKFRTMGKRDADREFSGSVKGFKYNAAGMALLVGWAVAATLLFSRLFAAGVVTIGVTVTIVASFPMALGSSWSVARRFKLSYECFVQTGYVFRLLDFPERTDGGASLPDGPMEIVFDNVVFRYPGTDRDVLKGVSFRIPDRAGVSLVGENGSGKSTVVKLLLRLYRPTSGRILLNGRDIGDYAEADYAARIGAVFQDFQKYELPLDENIALSDRPDLGKLRGTPFLDSATAAAGSETTFLGHRIEGGKDLSGGEWQKVAILRLLYRDPRVLVLDEPTASLDARAENEIYEQFHRLTKGRSALLISHRLALSRIADEIIVLDDGVIAERGTHDELMKKEGRYAALFREQAEWYAQTV